MSASRGGGDGIEMRPGARRTSPATGAGPRYTLVPCLRPVLERWGRRFGGRNLSLSFSSLAGPPNHCPPRSTARGGGEVVKTPAKQGCLGSASHSPATLTPVSRTSVTPAPLVPTESLEHNDKAPAGAAKGPPLTDDHQVRLALDGTCLPGTVLEGSVGALVVEG